MSRIQVLSPEVANVIAAGEVIERPASVVKELVENAIDAEATEIVIRLEEAGKRCITVSDNGCGLSAEDALLSLQRHATSKLRSPEDLLSVRTLGFRGEAMPSIAAIGTFRLVTRAQGAASGVEVRVMHGAQPVVRDIGCPVGTTVEVRDLFATVPARRKFLKGERTELAHIREMVTRLALATPHARFRLEHNGHVMLACHAVGDLGQRTHEIFGAEIGTRLIRIHEEGAFGLSGFCGVPALARSGASQLYTFVNGRAVRDRVMQHAVMEAYRTFIPHGDQPLVVLMLTMPPGEVDVNVHPTKAEVRFVNSGAVHHLISTAIRKCVEGHGEMRSATAERSRGAYPSARDTVAPTPLAVQEALTLYRPGMHEPRAAAPVSSSGDDTEHAPTDAFFKPLGQFAQTYLVYETTGGGLLLVDQHAAHERIGYETLKAQFRAGRLQQQLLLTPLVLELAPAASAALLEHRAELAVLGFEIDDFGKESVVVTSVPALLDQHADFAKLIAQMADDFQRYDRSTAVEERIDHLLATMACHRQIRAGDRLTTPHLQALVGDMQQGVSKDRCPHGRPTWVMLSKAEIEKWFHRR